MRTDAPAAPAASGRFEFNVGAFEAAYPDWRLEAGADGLGLRARLRTDRRAGGWISAATLDELAAQLDDLAESKAP